MLEVARGELPREYSSWDDINGKVPVEWRNGGAKNGQNDTLLRSPVADETGGGMIPVAMAKAKGQTLRLSGQIIDFVEPDRLPQPEIGGGQTDAYADGKRFQGYEYKSREAPAGGSRHIIEGFSSPLLPTPVAAEGLKATNMQTAEMKAKTGQVWLTNVAQSIRENNE